MNFFFFGILIYLTLYDIIFLSIVCYLSNTVPTVRYTLTKSLIETEQIQCLWMRIFNDQALWLTWHFTRSSHVVVWFNGVSSVGNMIFEKCDHGLLTNTFAQLKCSLQFTIKFSAKTWVYDHRQIDTWPPSVRLHENGCIYGIKLKLSGLTQSFLISDLRARMKVFKYIVWKVASSRDLSLVLFEFHVVFRVLSWSSFRFDFRGVFSHMIKKNWEFYNVSLLIQYVCMLMIYVASDLSLYLCVQRIELIPTCFGSSCFGILKKIDQLGQPRKTRMINHKLNGNRSYVKSKLERTFHLILCSPYRCIH